MQWMFICNHTFLAPLKWVFSKPFNVFNYFNFANNAGYRVVLKKEQIHCFRKPSWNRPRKVALTELCSGLKEVILLECLLNWLDNWLDIYCISSIYKLWADIRIPQDKPNAIALLPHRSCDIGNNTPTTHLTTSLKVTNPQYKIAAYQVADKNMKRIFICGHIHRL